MPGTIFSRQTMKTAIGKRHGARPAEIIQFDQAMFESKLDAMVREKVERIVNAMPDASGGRDRQRREIREKRRKKGVQGRPLRRTEPDRQGRQTRAQGPQAEGRGLRVGRDRTLPQARGERRGGADRHVPGRRVHQAGRRHQPIAVGRADALADALRQAQEGVRGHRLVAHEATGGEYPYVFMDGVWHKRSWGGHVENVSVLVAIGVNKEGHREVVGVAEGMKEDRDSWEQFVRGMIERGLKGVRLVVGDRCAGLVSTVNSMLAEGEVPAVHGALHAQRALQDAAKPPRMGVGGPEGDIRHGIPGDGPRQGRTGRHGDGRQEAEGRGRLPAGGDRRDDHVPAAGVPGRAPQEDTHEQYDRTAQPGDSAAHARRGQLPGREQRAHARLRAHQVRDRERVEHAPLPRHVPAR